MLKTLKRDWWKLLLIILVCGGIEKLKVLHAGYMLITLLLEKPSNIQMFFLTTFIPFVLATLQLLLQQVLPVFIHEQKSLWNIAWKYLVLIMLCEVILTILPFVLPLQVQVIRSLFTAVMLVFSIITYTLFLGFLCAVANATGLLAGIQTLITKYFLKYICILVIVKIIQKIIQLGVKEDLIFVAISALIQIAVVYICLPLFKKQAK